MAILRNQVEQLPVFIVSPLATGGVRVGFDGVGVGVFRIGAQKSGLQHPNPPLVTLAVALWRVWPRAVQLKVHVTQLPGSDHPIGRRTTQ